jgi:hypothetical protein
MAGCTKQPNARSSQVVGTCIAGGRAVTLTQVTVQRGATYDSGASDKILVFSTKDQTFVSQPAGDAWSGGLGDALLVYLRAGGAGVDAYLFQHSLAKTDGSANLPNGALKIKDLTWAGGQVSGHLTTGGQIEVAGHKVQIDLTFHTAQP